MDQNIFIGNIVVCENRHHLINIEFQHKYSKVVEPMAGDPDSIDR